MHIYCLSRSLHITRSSHLVSPLLSLASSPELKRQMELSNIVHDRAICENWAEGVSRQVQLNSDANVMTAKIKLVQGQVVLQVKG